MVPSHEKMHTLGHVLRARPDVLNYSSSPGTVLPSRGNRTRATLKVQDGCTHFCGFCSIPYTRKVLVSRPFGEVVREATALGASGVREIVVTGVCVGAYGPSTGSCGPNLPELLLAVADQPGVARVRLSSIQPIEVTDALIEAFASHSNLCPHLHLSCQSGDDAVLARMNRPYDTAFFKDRVRRLREAVPDVAITTDFIVGYPGETRTEHENTLRFARDIGFQKTHCFRYSPRPRTFAATLSDDVPHEEKVRRHAELQAVVDRTNRDFTARYIGQTLPVLVEGRDGHASGHTPNYLSVRFLATGGGAIPRELRGQIVPVRINGVTENNDATGTLALSDAELAACLAAAAPPAPASFLPLVMAADGRGDG